MQNEGVFTVLASSQDEIQLNSTELEPRTSTDSLKRKSKICFEKSAWLLHCTSHQTMLMIVLYYLLLVLVWLSLDKHMKISSKKFAMLLLFFRIKQSNWLLVLRHFNYVEECNYHSRCMIDRSVIWSLRWDQPRPMSDRGPTILMLLPRLI
jgi:hypothetical protein